jgi:hypothetical protein
VHEATRERVKAAIGFLPDGSIVLDRDGHGWTVCRDGGMVTRADYAGVKSLGIRVFADDHGPHKIIWVPDAERPFADRMEAESQMILDAVLKGSGFLMLSRHGGVSYTAVALDPATVTVRSDRPSALTREVVQERFRKQNDAWLADPSSPPLRWAGYTAEVDES